VDSGSDDNEDRPRKRRISTAKESKRDDVSDSEVSARDGTSDAPKRKKTKVSVGPSVRTQSAKTQAHYTHTKQRRDTSFKNWEAGMKRNAKPAKIKADIKEATADNLPQILENMRVLGFGVIRNWKKVRAAPFVPNDDTGSEDESSSVDSHFKSVFSEGNDPTPDQAYYHESTGWNNSKTARAPPFEVIFEGVHINSRDYEFTTRISKLDPSDTSHRETRKIMAPKSKALAAYNEKYVGQMRDIIKGMFANEPRTNGCEPANPDNWRLGQNVVWGGTGHQHPHCDQGKIGAFNNEQIFPFVCIHGFGLHEFVMWLLPLKKKREYGFPYCFHKNALLFLRGDLPHAGAFSQLSRGHLEFFPTVRAGWTQSRNPYWRTDETMAKWQEKKVVFLIPDMRTHSFAFPHVTEEDDNGNQIVTYPPEPTSNIFPDLDGSSYLNKRTHDGDTALNSVGTASAWKAGRALMENKRTREPELTTARGKPVRRKPM
jgi:hypothetical protein